MMNRTYLLVAAALLGAAPAVAQTYAAGRVVASPLPPPDPTGPGTNAPSVEPAPSLPVQAEAGRDPAPKTGPRQP